MKTQSNNLKFGIRFGNAKRGKIIHGMTIADYITSLGATSSAICPTGGWFKSSSGTTSFGITIY